MSLISPLKILLNHDASGSVPCAASFAETPDTQGLAALETSLGPALAARCRAYHEGIPHNRQTPLHDLPELASRLGLGALRVKDESWRMGLNAFKALGSTWAVACAIAERLGMDPDGDNLDFPTLARLARENLKDKPFLVTASDGNHGRGLAFAARLFGLRARVLLPSGTARARHDNILCEGGEAEITSLTYDECVLAAAREAERGNGLLVQDTAFAGYESIPLRIMQGYLTMAHEIFGQMEDASPTHVFLQAGVGSFAASLASCLGQYWDVVTILVEPTSADCLFRTMRANDGQLHAVDGPMDSVMAGLCCGCPSTLAMGILAQRGRAFIACEDDAAELGMRLYAHPLGRDPQIVSGESGACTLGVLAAIMLGNEETRESLGLDASSCVLLVSTEGDTDPVNYRHVLEKGPVPVEPRQGVPR